MVYTKKTWKNENDPTLVPGVDPALEADELNRIEQGIDDAHAHIVDADEHITAAERTKIAGIEANATGDQTGAEIKTAYELEANTNAYTDAEKAKLATVASGATDDQTGAEIKVLYEAEADTNAYTDAEKSKLAGVQSGATDDQTGAEIKIAYEAELNTNAYTDAEKAKLAALDSGATDDQTASEIVGLINASAELIDDNNIAATIARDSEVTSAISSHASDVDAHHSNTNDPTADEKSALAGTSGTPSGLNKFVTNDDARLTDNRPPEEHTHTEVEITDLGTYIPASEKAAANGIASLDGDSKVPISQLPAIAITDTFEVGTEPAMLALSVQIGDIAIRSDLNKSFILAAAPATVLANWKELKTPTDAVISVDGKTGAVNLSGDYEPIFSKNSGFNKNFGTTTGTVAQGNDSRFTDARVPLAHTQAASTITDFDTEVSNNTDVAANTAARHSNTNDPTADQKAAMDAAALPSGTNAFATIDDLSGGVSDHGALTGLADDDHTQYLNDARGDARYLYRENTTPFTPDADYEPATKKYVDDTALGAGAVSSVFGRAGSVIAVAGDYDASEVTNAFDKTADDADDIDTTVSINKFTTAGDIAKLAGIEASADVNNISDLNATDLTDGGDTTLHIHNADRARSNHTGTQVAATISDFATAVSAHTDVSANTTKLAGIEAGATADQTKADIDALGIDAATLDGIDSTDFIRASVNSLIANSVQLQFGSADNKITGFDFGPGLGSLDFYGQDALTYYVGGSIVAGYLDGYWQFNDDILPATPFDQSLGAVAKKWANVYAENGIFGTSLNVGGNAVLSTANIDLDMTNEDDTQCPSSNAVANYVDSELGTVTENALYYTSNGEFPIRVTEKLVPIAADKLLIEDSAALGAKKYIEIGNLPGGGGAGDMLAATYDPTTVAGDAFDMDNMVAGTTNKLFTATDETKLDAIEASADVTDATNVAAAGALMTTGGSMSGDINAVNNDVLAIKTATFNAVYDNGSPGATPTIDWNNGQRQKITLTANSVVSFTAFGSGIGSVILEVIQDATGGRTVTWPVSVDWLTGTPSLDETANASTIISFYYDGTTYWGAAPTVNAGSTVDSVFGRTGDVVAAINDYTWAQVDKTISDIADITTKSHTSLTDIGTNTHAQIDTHITNFDTNVSANTDVAANTTKLAGIETAATADQTGAEIKTAYEAELDTNAFTDALQTKLNGVEALADVTDATNVAAAGALMASGGTMTGDIDLALQSILLDNANFPNCELVADGGYSYLKGHHAAALQVQGVNKFAVSSSVATMYVALNMFGSRIYDAGTVTFNAEYDNLTSGTAKLIDWNNGQKQKLTLSDNCTITITNFTDGIGNVTLKLIQDVTGGRTVTWPATVKWEGGVAPTLTATANAVDIVSFYFDGTNYYGTIGLDFQ